MNILERNIQDARDNVTRFIVLSRDPLIALLEDPRAFKTSVVFSLPSRPGEVGTLLKRMVHNFCVWQDVCGCRHSLQKLSLRMPASAQPYAHA